MDRDCAKHWKVLMDEDLAHARSSLSSSSEEAGAFLRGRIAEDEAILERLAALESANSMSEASHASASV